MKYCPNCGAQVQSGQTYCTNCGYKLTTSQVSKAKSQPTNNSQSSHQNFENPRVSAYTSHRGNHRLSLKIIIAIIIVLFLGGGVFIHHKLGSFHHQVWGSIMQVQVGSRHPFYVGNYKNSCFAFAKSEADLPTDMSYISEKQSLKSLGVNESLFDSSGISEKEFFEDFDWEDSFQDTNTEITYSFTIKPKNDEGRLQLEKPIHYKLRFYNIKKLANKRWSANGEVNVEVNGERRTQNYDSVSIQKVN